MKGLALEPGVGDFKNHILQLSGFACHEGEKKRSEVKEKLSKCNKYVLLELCHSFDLSGSKAKRKEELMATLMEFLKEPRSAIDTTPPDKKTRGRKRKRDGESASKSPGGEPLRGLKKNKPEETTLETWDEEEADGSEGEEVGLEYSEGDLKHYTYEDVNNKEGQFPKEEANSEPSETLDCSTNSEKLDGVTLSEIPIPTNELALASTPSVNASVTSKKATSNADHKEKSAGKRVTRGDAKPKRWAVKPTRDELKQAVCFILDTADFATMTFGDVVKEVDKYFSKDLSAKKPLIRSLIEEELFRLAEEAEKKELEEEEIAEAKARAEEAAIEKAKDERVESGKDAKAEMVKENLKDKADEFQACQDGISDEAAKNGNGDGIVKAMKGRISVKAAENRNGNDTVESSEAGKAKADGKNENNDDEFTKDGKAEEAAGNVNGDDDLEGSEDGTAKKAKNDKNNVENSEYGKTEKAKKKDYDDDVECSEDGRIKEARNGNGENNIEDVNNGKGTEESNTNGSENSEDVECEKDGKAQEANNNENGVKDVLQGAEDGKAEAPIENIDIEVGFTGASNSGRAEDAEDNAMTEADVDGSKDAIAENEDYANSGGDSIAEG